MSIVTIEEIFQRVEKFENSLEAYYARIRDESEDNGVRLLTFYLARHRQHLQKVLADLETGDVELIKKVKLKYDVGFPPGKDVTLMEVEPGDMKAKQLLEASAEYDQALIDLYKSILSQPLGAKATVLFESLVKVEERDIVMIKKMIAMNYF